MRRFIICCILSICCYFSYSQTDSTAVLSTVDSLAVTQDTSIVALDSSLLTLESIQDSLNLSEDSLKNVNTRASSEIETTINYNATDSIFFDLKGRKLNMYGETHIDYGTISLDADRTDVDMRYKTIKSTFREDTTGEIIGKPVFDDSQDSYQTDVILYNFQTRRAQIKGVVTEQDGAFMHGDDVKKNEDDEMFIRGARYTTCNLEHPHFFIQSEKIKVIPGNKVVSGPFHLKFRDVSTPLAFPFGMFPQPKRQASGIIFPSYGEERRRGFFLRNGGYYLALNDYMDLRMTGDIYTRGGKGLTVNTNYRKRYSFSGSMNFQYTQNVSEDVENPILTNDFWYRWSHRQESRGTGNFSASVSLGTSTYNANSNLVAQDFSRSTQSQYASNVSYSKRFVGTPFNMTLNARQSQNLATGIMNVSLPDFAFNTSRQYPFKKFVNNSNNPLAKLNFSHNMTATNQLTNRIANPFPFQVSNFNEADFDSLTLRDDLNTILQFGKNGVRHQLPVSTSVSLLKFFTLSPSFNYQEVWFFKELDYTYLSEEEAVRVDTTQRFSRANSWSSGASLNTVIYGTHFFKGDGKVQAIRHVITPALSFSYNPDFSGPGRGVYETIQRNATDSIRVSKYQGFAYPSPTGTESRSLGFNIQNNLEMKVLDPEDSVTGTKKVKIFDNLSMSSSYNFAADSFKLAPIRLSTRTSFFENAVSIAVGGTLDPYIYSREGSTSIGTRIDRYAWNAGRGLGQLSSSNVAISMRLKSGMGRGDSGESEPEPQTFGDDPFNPVDEFGNPLEGTDAAEAEFIRRNPNEYVDFDVPWTLNISYSITRTKRGFEDAIFRQTLSFNGTLKLTPKTNLNLNSGYDLERREFTQTRINISRDLHCWGLTFGWVPFGRFQSFSLVIQPKASLLQDLKLQRKRSFLDFFDN